MLAVIMVCTCSNHRMMVDSQNDHGHACDMTPTVALNDCNACLTVADKVLDVSVDIDGVVWVALGVYFDATLDQLSIDFVDGMVHPPPALDAVKMNC